MGTRKWGRVPVHAANPRYAWARSRRNLASKKAMSRFIVEHSLLAFLNMKYLMTFFPTIFGSLLVVICGI